MSKSGIMYQVKTDQWVKPFFKQYKKMLALALFLGLLTFIFASALMFTSGYLITRSAEIPWTIMMIHAPTLYVRIFGIGKPILQYIERLTSHDWVLRMTSHLRLKLYTTLEKDAIFFKRKYKTGDILGLLAEDIGHLQNLYLRTIFPTIIAWLLYVVLVVVLGFFSVGFALFMFLMMGVAVFLVPLVSVLFNRARQARRKAIKNELYSELTDNVMGASDWIFAQRGEEYLEHYKTAEQELRLVDQKLDSASRKRDLVLQVLFGVTAVVLLIWAGGYFGGSYGGASNWIVAFVLGFFPLVDAFAPVPTAVTEATIYQDSIQRFNKLSKESEEAAIGQAEEGAEKNTATLEPDLPLTLQVDGLGFSYPHTNRSVLKEIDLTIKQGEKLAILGRSGSGKSTLASLLRGDLSPSQGSITLGGIPTQQFGDKITQYVGVIQQQSYLFNKTLFENLRIGSPDASEEKAWEVLEHVGLKEMAKRLPQGLHTMVDEAGLRFSGGERHRIALARVLLQDVPFIILDEPTVGLDPLTEAALLETFFENTQGKTLIMITHHLQGVAHMDRVVFIEDGLLSMTGAPSELEKSNIHYQKLLAFDKGINPA